MERQIREDYCNHKIKLWPFLANTDDTNIAYVFIDGYFGTYNNCIAVIFNDGQWAMPKQDIVEGIVFGYTGGGRTIKIWDEGNIYELQEAFDSGLINKEDLESIAYYWNITRH